MPWLCREGEVLASVEVADTRVARRQGLIGRDGIDGALLLVPAFAVHTLAMDFAIDVAYLGADSEVLAITTMRPFRIGRPRFRAKAVLEAEAGSFARWGIEVGDVLEAR
ncbi:MAG: DUF192 domain-containing protein [Acidimicrobiia bacterium]